MTDAKEAKDEFVLEEDDDIEGLQIAMRSMDLKKLENADEAKAGGFNVKQVTPEDDLFAVKDVSDEAKSVWAVKPWLGSIVEPKNAPANVTSAPDKKLELTWAYGYRGHDCCSNIVVNTQGKIIYPTASLMVAYDERKHTQNFFQACNDDIVCLAQNPKNKNIVAAGQVATLTEGKSARQATPPHISVQDTTDAKAVWTLRDPKVLQRVARAIAFNCDGDLLAAVGGDDNSTVSIWDWKSQKCLASMGNRGEMVLNVRWSNKRADSFVTVGVKHCCEWTFAGGKLSRNKVKTSAKAPLQTYYSIAYSDAKGVACVGARDGRVYFISGGAFAHIIPAHKGSVFTIDCCKAGMITGGEDGHVNIYSPELKLQNTLECESPVKTVYAREDGGLIVGTSRCEIFSLPDFKTAPRQTQPIVQSHSDGETWAVTPAGAEFAYSAGEDNRVFKWSLTQHKCVGMGIINPKAGMKPQVRKAATMSKHPPNQCVRSIALRPDGKEIAVGTNAGELNVFSTADMKLVKSVDLNQYGKRQVTNQTQNWIEVVSYSPNGQFLAVGTHGIVTVILDVPNYTKHDVITKHNAAITKIDWSDDSAFIQSTCKAYELLYFSVDPRTGKATQVAPKSMSGVKWATQTCCFGWPVQGIFGNGTDMTEVNAVDASPDRKLLATGDDYGYVNLFRYPCCTPSNAKRIAKGHSSHVQNVKFTPDGRYVLSAGGNDKAVLQWAVVNA